jgi:hypothetical protein
MKPQTENSVSLRCAHRTPGGRQCRLLAYDTQSGLCPQHHAEQKQQQEDDHFDYLIRNNQCFQTAQGINFSLGNLYALLAQNLISPRRAAVLAYVSSLMLRTLPQIDADTAAGIKDPSKLLDKPLPVPVPVPDPVRSEAAAPDLNPGSSSESASASIANSPANPGSSNTWDSSNPEPDPNKKPS